MTQFKQLMKRYPEAMGRYVGMQQYNDEIIAKARSSLPDYEPMNIDEFFAEPDPIPADEGADASD